MGKVRLDVIGAGSGAEASHLSNLARHKDVEFVGDARKGVEVFKKIQDRYGFTVA